MKGLLKRQLSLFNTAKSGKETITKVGDVVKDFIKSSKKDADAEKKRMLRERK